MNGVNGCHRTKVWEEPMGTKRRIKVIFIGMGASGVNFAYQLDRQTTNVELVIYEKNNDIGGTWYENTYDGCACDVPSVCYQFTWARKPDWSHFYSRSEEIHGYFADVADKHGLLKYVKLQHKLVKAEWLGDCGKWRVTIEHPGGEFQDEGDFLINGGGILNNWHWPNIRGLQEFEGKVMHTAAWDRSYDLHGKRVLHVGIGSSGVQVVRNIIDKVDELHIFARSPAWISGGPLHPYSSKKTDNFEYSAAAKERFEKDPDYYLAYSKSTEAVLNPRFRLFLRGTPETEAAKKRLAADMAKRLNGRTDLIKALVPEDFDVACRRPTPAYGFLEALTQEKTHVYTGEIPQITDTGFIDHEGRHHDVDVIICATGFDTSFRPRFPVLFDGINLQDQYEKEVLGYLGLGCPEVPNYFAFLNTYAPFSHGSLFATIEKCTSYVIQVLEKTQTENIKRLSVKRSAAEDFTRYADEWIERSVWVGPCASWFRNNGARKPVCWPGSRVHGLTALDHPRYEHFDIEYVDGNSCSFLGNGFATREFDGRDLTWYMGLLENEDKQPPEFKLDIDDGSGNFQV